MQNICGSCFHESVNEQGVCIDCGFSAAKNREEFPQALPPGSILYGQFVIGKVLGQGGFGITYLAQDHRTGQLVAIKEFFPGAMATRSGVTVVPYSGVQGENFTYGKNTFLDEAKTMAEFNGSPNIAGVQMYFEENGTAYFVMEYLEGSSLGQYIASHGGRLSWDETIGIMLPVLDVLNQIHSKGVIHRDVAPDNIFILGDGTVKLLDFGAARHSLGNVSQSLDVVVKHGFAPKEQYSRRGRQGPYTDVYAASATIYYALTGVKPDESIDRADEDTMPPPSILGAKLSQEHEDALMKGLSVDAKDRYQSAGELRDALTSNDPVVIPIIVSDDGSDQAGSGDSVPVDPPDPGKTAAARKNSGSKKLAAAAAALLLVLFGIFWFTHPHKYGDWKLIEEATCLEAGTEQRKCFCGAAEHREVAALGHTVVTDPAVAPSCTTTGLSEGSHCSVCSEVLAEQLVLSMTLHEVVTLAEVAPTCTETGLTEGVGCPNCGYSEVEQQVIPALGHTEVTDPAVQATCLAEGKTEGSHCSVCEVVLTAQETLSKTDCTPVTDPAVKPTCAKEGKTEGSHCSVCEKILVAQDSIAKVSHTPVTDKAVAATCAKEGKTEGSHCSVCDTVIVKQKSVSKLAHTPVTDKAVEATCSREGKTEGSHCSVCGTVIKAQSSVSALDHQFSKNKCQGCGIAEIKVSISLPVVRDDVYNSSKIAVYFRPEFVLTNYLGETRSYSCNLEWSVTGGTVSSSGAISYPPPDRASYTGTLSSVRFMGAPGDTVTVRVYYDGVQVAKASYTIKDESNYY